MTSYSEKATSTMFKAIVVEKDESGYRAGLKEVDESALPAGDVTVRAPAQTPARAGDAVTVYLDPGALHWFDAGSQLRVAA